MSDIVIGKVKNKSMSVSFKPSIFNKIESICAERGCTRSWFVNKAVEQYMIECQEDKDDYVTAVTAWEEFEKSGKKGYSLDEVKKELGL